MAWFQSLQSTISLYGREGARQCLAATCTNPLVIATPSNGSNNSSHATWFPSGYCCAGRMSEGPRSLRRWALFPLSILAQARAAILPHLMSGTRHNGSRWVRMPRYFFNVYHERSEPDDLGEMLPDRQAAWKEATITAVKSCRAWTENCDPAVIGGWRSPTSLQIHCTSSVSVPNMHLLAASSLACGWGLNAPSLSSPRLPPPRLPIVTRRCGIITQYVARQEAVDCCGYRRGVRPAS